MRKVQMHPRLTFNLLGERLQQLQPHLQRQTHSFKPPPPQSFTPTSTCIRFPYVVAVVVPELQTEVLLLQQLQVTTDFVEEVSP